MQLRGFVIALTINASTANKWGITVAKRDAQLETFSGHASRNAPRESEIKVRGETQLKAQDSRR
jgi:hypothetical protein